jgi:C4-dicarboxylate-specific signal transduction histidine kinase
MLLDLARAEAIRAGWLADALAVLQREPLPALDQVNLNAVVARVADTLGPEQRITGQASSFSWPDAPVTVFGDDRLLTVAVGGMLQALGACVEGRETGIVGVRVTSLREGMTRGVEVAQSGVRMSPAVLSRLFDAEWTDHPAGATGAVFLAAAHRIATLQGGTLDARSMEAGGCRLVLGLPAAD